MADAERRLWPLIASLVVTLLACGFVGVMSLRTMAWGAMPILVPIVMAFVLAVGGRGNRRKVRMFVLLSATGLCTSFAAAIITKNKITVRAIAAAGPGGVNPESSFRVLGYGFQMMDRKATDGENTIVVTYSSRDCWYLPTVTIEDGRARCQMID